MQSWLPRWAWIISIAAYGVLAGVLYLLTAGAAIAPCLGGPGPEQDEARRVCAQQWFESRPIWEKLFNSPFMAVVFFVALVLLTAWLTRVRAPERDQAVHLRGS
jgi:ribose/xylose/arabinose/galactoside ABC-type transport system permease subunit